MRTIAKLSLAAAIIGLGASPALSQTTASTSGSTSILRAVSITKDNDLAFGRIVRPSSGTSDVTLTDASDTVSVSGNGLSGGGTTSRAKYTINGEGGQAVSYDIPADFLMTHTNTVDVLQVTLDPSATGGTLSGSLGSAGSVALNIGGTFQVTTTTEPGAYSGTFDVDVAYQ